MSAALRDAFERQAEACENLGSPFMGRLMGLCADHLAAGTDISDRLLTWPGDVSSNGHSVPLRLAGALHALVLQGHALAAVYPPNTVPDDTLWQAVQTAFTTDTAHLMSWLDSPPQTNEVRRSAALLIAASSLSAQHNLPFVLSELGASAGLNLNFDRYGLGDYGDPASSVQLTPRLQGLLPPNAPIRVRARAGVDLNPLDPARDRKRLLAYLWPDQPERLALTRAALDLVPPKPDQGDAGAWLQDRLQHRFEGALHLVFHTIAWQYFPPQTQAACAKALAEAGAKATPTAPLAHLSMEADAQPNGAVLALTTWPGGKTKILGRVDFHGRWLTLA